MEDDEQELEVLSQAISHLEEAEKCFCSCDSISLEEYNNFQIFIERLIDRKIKLQIKCESIKFEEI